MTTELEFTGVVFEFVVDVSGSMSDFAPGAAIAKWNAIRPALANFVANLPDWVSVGVIPYPNMQTIPNNNTTALPVETCVNTAATVTPGILGAPGSAQRLGISQLLSSVTVAGGTPVADAYQYALTNLVRPTLNGIPYVILITDSQPTIAAGCNGLGEASSPVDVRPVLDAIQAAHSLSRPITTFVIGLPGSEALSSTGTDGRASWSEAATLGGKPRTPDCTNTGPNYCHFDLTTSVDLTASLASALDEISTSSSIKTLNAIPCEFTPIPTGPKPGCTNLIYRSGDSNGPINLLIAPSSPSCEDTNGDGWYWNESNGAVRLCPNTCSMLQKPYPSWSLDFYFGCNAAITGS